MFDDVIQLVAISYTTDKYGVKHRTETKNQVFARVSSIGSSEFFNAQQSGLKATYVFKICSAEYNGEALIEYKDKQYDVYRTYMSSQDVIEIYVEDKSGTK